MKLKQNCLKFNPSDMAQLKVIAASKGLSMAAFVRFLIAREVRRAAKQAASAK
ncbi:MAG TPA: hypothetical protein VN822_10265 [Candidatus Acidoferrales bacterium]|nr:hypothetical protein [Candidatus Acidoferrales bacterium]